MQLVGIVNGKLNRANVSFFSPSRAPVLYTENTLFTYFSHDYSDFIKCQKQLKVTHYNMHILYIYRIYIYEHICVYQIAVQYTYFR